MKNILAKIRGSRVLSIIACAVIIVLIGAGAFALYEHHQAKVAAGTLTINGNVDLREVSLAFKNSDRIAEVLALTEGGFAPVPYEELEEHPYTAYVWENLEGAITRCLENMTLADVLAAGEEKITSI